MENRHTRNAFKSKQINDTMAVGDNMKKRNIIIFILACLLIAAIIYILLNLRSCSAPSNQSETITADREAIDYTGDRSTTQLTDGKAGIAISGFKSLVFHADQLNQKVNFNNPKNNNCFQVMTLLVNNQNYWKSGYIAPGKGYYSIELTKPIPKGDYTAILKVDCYRNDFTPLNSANIEFELQVI